MIGGVLHRALDHEVAGLEGDATMSGDRGGCVLDGEANIVPTDDDGIAFARTPRQVADIVYFAPDAAMGGFFPEGITVPAGLEEDFGTLLSL